MPKHRNTFTQAEWNALRVLVDRLRGAEKKDRELIRGGLRGMGFYISDYSRAEDRFVTSDMDRILQEGRVQIDKAA
jgi:hypothetical protein